MNIEITPTQAMVEALNPYLEGRKIISIRCEMNNMDRYKRNMHLQKNSKKRKRSFECLNNHEVYQSIKDAAIELSLDPGAISRCLSGKQGTTQGYSFKYKE